MDTTSESRARHGRRRCAGGVCWGGLSSRAANGLFRIV